MHKNDKYAINYIMQDLKIILLISVWALALILVILAVFLKLKKPAIASKHKLTFIIIFASLLMASSQIRTKMAKFKISDCFIVRNYLAPGEETEAEAWDKVSELKDVEFQVLKVGEKNYLTHSSLPRLGNFSFSRDVFLEKSDCSMIFKGNK